MQQAPGKNSNRTNSQFPISRNTNAVLNNEFHRLVFCILCSILNWLLYCVWPSQKSVYSARGAGVMVIKSTGILKGLAKVRLSTFGASKVLCGGFQGRTNVSQSYLLPSEGTVGVQRLWLLACASPAFEQWTISPVPWHHCVRGRPRHLTLCHNGLSCFFPALFSGLWLSCRGEIPAPLGELRPGM